MTEGISFLESIPYNRTLYASVFPLNEIGQFRLTVTKGPDNVRIATGESKSVLTHEEFLVLLPALPRHSSYYYNKLDGFFTFAPTKLIYHVRFHGQIILTYFFPIF
jgi:hypothetical protein